MDNMLSATHPLRVSLRPTHPTDSDELPQTLTAIARIYINLKHALIPTSGYPSRSAKRRRVLTDMPREGKLSPSRRSPPPTKSSQGTSDKNSSVSAREKLTNSPSRDGKQGRDRSGKPPSVAVAPSSTGLPSRGAPSHQTASHNGASPVASRLRMSSPETSAFVQARIYHRRVELINKLMAIITPCIERTLNAWEAAYDGEGRLPGRTGTKRGIGSVSSSGSGGGLSMGQKRGSGNQSHESDGENEGDQRGGSRITKRTKTITERNKKFACPYYKHDPTKYAHVRTCSGPGWDEVHRMKEHLDRRHELPKAKCHRCYEHFAEERELEDHLRMDVPCIVRERGSVDPIQGFDEQQKKQLKSGRKTKLTEVERWREVYSILFRIPIDSPEMPSPYYESSDLVHVETTAAVESVDFKACMNYCRREAPKVIRQALESDVDRELSNIQEKMKFKLARIVETSLDRLLTTYQSIKRPEEVSNMPDPNSALLARDVVGTHASSPSPVLQNDMASLIHSFLPEDVDFGAALVDFEGLYPGNSFQQDEQGSMCQQSFEADSGYRTYSDGASGSDPSEHLNTPVYDSRQSHRYYPAT